MVDSQVASGVPAEPVSGSTGARRGRRSGRPADIEPIVTYSSTATDAVAPPDVPQPRESVPEAVHEPVGSPVVVSTGEHAPVADMPAEPAPAATAPPTSAAPAEAPVIELPTEATLATSTNNAARERTRPSHQPPRAAGASTAGPLSRPAALDLPQSTEPAPTTSVQPDGPRSLAAGGFMFATESCVSR